jgi:hypothetical protein
MDSQVNVGVTPRNTNNFGVGQPVSIREAWGTAPSPQLTPTQLLEVESARRRTAMPVTSIMGF